ncbi:MAG: PorP/SprF family type IX secretion system membrane protein [Marinifilaceae bacterium]|jgi:type IX secretion system PorP/SprF family membrane protein|nr:PorP/SprF family type IX secretion system membrane protein [Marinifilaceae bacterium]
MKRVFTILLFCFLAFNIFAQKLPLIHYYDYSMQFNPSFSVLENTARLNFLSRQQEVSSSEEFKIALIHVSIPVYKDEKSKHLAVVSSSFLSDKFSAHNLFKEETMSFSFAYRLRLSRMLNLGLAISWASTQRFFDISKFTTGSQYVLGRGFSPELSNNEENRDFSGGYSSWNTGLVLTKNYSKDFYRFILGISYYNLNKPKYASKYTNERLNATLGLQAAYRFRLSNNIYIKPDIESKINTYDEWLNFGSSFEYFWNKSQYAAFSSGAIAIRPRYVLDKAYSIGIMYSQSLFQVSYAKSINSVKSNNSHFNSNEISLSINTNFSRKEKNQLVKRASRLKSKIFKPIENFSWEDEYWNITNINSHEIIDEGLEKFIQTIIQRYIDKENIAIHIYAYTDMLDTEAKNIEISVKRAECIAKYFRKNGFAKNRIDYFGKGNSSPKLENAYGQDRLKNRYIEFKICKIKQ